MSNVATNIAAKMVEDLYSTDALWLYLGEDYAEIVNQLDDDEIERLRAEITYILYDAVTFIKSNQGILWQN